LDLLLQPDDALLKVTRRCFVLLLELLELLL
jgi:hypothetical protein